MAGAQSKKLSGLGSRWIDYIEPDELEQLAILERRIQIKEQSLSELKARRARLRRRCIVRAQRDRKNSNTRPAD